MHLNKYICDFCGKDCEREEYNIPMFEEEIVYAEDSKGAKLFPSKNRKLSIKTVNLCEDCKIKAARLMELSRYADLNKHDICIIDKEDC